MIFKKAFHFHKNNIFTALFCLFIAVFIQSCSTFNYKTYDEKANENIDDPDPNYNLTLSEDFQNYTNFMFIGNRVENFGTYFNTFFNAKENYNDAYDDYLTRTLANYGESIDSVYITASLSQESIDKFNEAIKKASKVIQYHKSSAFMDQAVLLIGKCYYFLGDNIKAERKFSEFISKLSNSRYYDEAVLYYAKTQLRLNNVKDALEKIENLTKNSKNNSIKAQAYQSIAEYYLSLKDYESAIANFKKSIELSSDEEFKAQMQFLIASVTVQTDMKNASAEYNKVLSFSPKYEIEYLAKYNSIKYDILSGSSSSTMRNAEKLQVKYKDVDDYVAQVEFLKGRYYAEKKNYKKAIQVYDDVLLTYPKTSSSSDASFEIGQYYEKVKNDYLNAFRYYRYSTEESSSSHNAVTAVSKISTYKRYFELKSVITGVQINTDYDSSFIGKKVNPEQDGNPLDKGLDNNGNNNNNNNGNNNHGKPGGFSSNMLFSTFADTVVDSSVIKEEAITKAKFELAELFYYNLQRPDSSEYYLVSALNQSNNYDFKSKVLFAMADLYKSTGQPAKAEEILNRILKEYPLSPVINDTRRLLNLSQVEEESSGADSLYLTAENKFLNMEYPAALEGFKNIINNYPGSKYADKSIYAAGWIYENIIFRPDSAYLYYSEIMKSYPNSEAAGIVFQKVEEYQNSISSQLKDSTGMIKDSSGVVKDSVENKGELKDTSSVKKTDETGIEENKNEEINPNLKEKNPVDQTPIEKPVEENKDIKKEEIPDPSNGK